MGKISGANNQAEYKPRDKRDQSESAEKPQVVWSRLGAKGRKEYEWAIAWGIIKAFFVLAPIIVLIIVLIPILLAGVAS